MFASLDCPAYLVMKQKAQSWRSTVFLIVHYFPERVGISDSGSIHDKKLGETIHNNCSNYIPASGQTTQAAFLMAIHHWENESRS